MTQDGGRQLGARSLSRLSARAHRPDWRPGAGPVSHHDLVDRHHQVWQCSPVVLEDEAALAKIKRLLEPANASASVGTTQKPETEAAQISNKNRLWLRAVDLRTKFPQALAQLGSAVHCASIRSRVALAKYTTEFTCTKLTSFVALTDWRDVSRGIA